jgi:peptidoglycan/xylan/chitin deacetylase (PgdA/CDA1 family)
MQNYKNFLHTVLFFILFSTTILNADQSQYNLLKNSGFEAGSSGWDSYGSAIDVSSDSHTGLKALAFHTGGTGQATDLLPNIEEIDGNAKYVLNGYYKHVGTVDGMWIGIVYFDSNWETIGEDSMEVSLSSSYKKFELISTPPAGTNYMSFWAWSDAQSGGITLMDDIKLYPKTFTPSACTLLQNGNFEKNLDGWSLYSSQTLRINNGYNSAYAIQLLEGGMDQTITLFDTAQNTYQFNGYYKTNGTPSGTWVGMNFYDSNNNLLFEKSIELEASSTYKKFIVNATTSTSVKSIQVWVWTEGGSSNGKVILDNLALTATSCLDYTAPSSLPPGGMSVSNSPQFVVLGFDDNTISEGINWALELFNNKKNHDNSKVLASFYMNTAGLDQYIEDDPATLLTAMQALKDTDHEIGNHTYDHHQGLNEAEIIALNNTQWNKSITDCEIKLKNEVGVAQSDLKGFRSPYLLYNQNALNVLKTKNYLYDCSIEEGYSQQFDGKNFRWPYQLNEGSPGHNESWYGNPENPNAITIGPVEGLWELPVYVLMIPKDKDCAKYGITKGLWSRIKDKMPYLDDYKITSFDYNLWHLAELNKEEVLGILKYNLDLRLAGNRAPMTFGAHTQYYTDSWSQNAPNATTTQMREAISGFIEYALSKPEVRVTTAEKVINWCQNPIALPQN